MKKMQFPVYIILAIAMLTGCARKTYQPVSTGVESYAEEEGALQEPAWTYFERLSYAFGGDSACVGMTDSMDYPDWYSGCFVNEHDRLTINVVGDTAALRPLLASLVRGNEFDMGTGVCSKTEQTQTMAQLRKAVAEKFHGNMTSSANSDGSITISLEGDNDTVITTFRREVFDSPILRFKVADVIDLIPL